MLKKLRIRQKSDFLLKKLWRESFPFVLFLDDFFVLQNRFQAFWLRRLKFWIEKVTIRLFSVFQKRHFWRVLVSINMFYFYITYKHETESSYIAPRYNTCMFSIFLNTHLEEIINDVWTFLKEQIILW